MFPILPVMEAKESVDDILQLFAQSFLPTITAEMAKDIIQLLFDMLLVSILVYCWLGLVFTVSYRGPVRATITLYPIGDLLELLLRCIL